MTKGRPVRDAARAATVAGGEVVGCGSVEVHAWYESVRTAMRAGLADRIARRGSGKGEVDGV